MLKNDLFNLGWEENLNYNFLGNLLRITKANPIKHYLKGGKSSSYCGLHQEHKKIWLFTYATHGAMPCDFEQLIMCQHIYQL